MWFWGFAQRFFFTKAEILKYFIVVNGIVRPSTAKAWKYVVWM